MATGIWISLVGYFVLMIAIGIYAMRKATSSSEDYMLGGRALSPQVAALSAGASDMSGWLLLGLPGAMFVSGLGSAWIGIGLLVGAFFNWTLVAPRLREQTVHYGNAITIPEFLANRFPTRALSLRTVSAVVIVIFFAVYTASGLVAGGKLFESAFSGIYNFGGMSDYAMGVVITLGVVLAYTVVGGFLAVSLTDFVQGCIMMLALVIMPAVVLFGEGGGGFAQASQTLNRSRPHAAILDGGTDLRRVAVCGDLGAGLFRAAAYHRALHGHPHAEGCACCP
jgi:solute:Na+ symporter, SSS family